MVTGLLPEASRRFRVVEGSRETIICPPGRVHLDIKTDDLEAEVQRLERLGATRVKKVKHWWVLEAPSGHRFCVIPLHPGQELGNLNTWDANKKQ